jgi:hypothetical protein
MFSLFAYLYQSVIGISFSWSQIDPIKRGPLYLILLQTVYMDKEESLVDLKPNLVKGF